MAVPGAAILFAAMLPINALGHAVFRVAADDRSGILSGAAGNPAVVAYANRTLPGDRIDVAFATMFPSKTILKILCEQIAISVLNSHPPP